MTVQVLDDIAVNDSRAILMSMNIRIYFLVMFLMLRITHSCANF